MPLRARGAAALLGIAMLAAAPFSALSSVSAHTCSSTLRQSPVDPNDADTGCDGASCPASSGTQPHHHDNTLPRQECRNCWPPGQCRGQFVAQHAGSADFGCSHRELHAHVYLGTASTRDGETSRGAATSSTTGCTAEGIGGGFFGYGPWATDPACGIGNAIHGGSVTVRDASLGASVPFVIGADDTSGPSAGCTTDGTITTDPADPAYDPDDCLSVVYRGSGVTCGAGGDGGYWVFVLGPATSGTITA